MKEEKKIYTCICGKEYDNSQSINAHKARCKQWFIFKDGNLDKYNEISKKRVKTYKENIKIKNIEKQKHADEIWKQSQHKCEQCGKIMNERYGCGRFCSKSCASKRKLTGDTKNKISVSLSKYYDNNLQTIGQRVIHSEDYKKKEANKKQSFNKGLVKTSTGYLDITNEELGLYREKQKVCEICGKPERTTHRISGKIQQLSIDHNHDTNKFRGLLCSHCNRNLGWFEANLFGILDYFENNN